MKQLKDAIFPFVISAAALLLAACGGSRPSISGDLSGNSTIRQMYENPGTLIAGAPSAKPPEYRLGFLDEVEVRVEFHDRFNEIIKIRPDGRATFVNLENLYVVGMTPTELDSVITMTYANLITDPQVTVFVRTFAGNVIYVMGEVDNPGVFEMRPGMTILQAIAAGGGAVRAGKLGSVLLLRRGESNKQRVYKFDLSREAIEGGQSQDKFLYAQDIVFVPKTTIANVNDFLSQFWESLLPPFDTYLRAVREYGRD